MFYTKMTVKLSVFSTLFGSAFVKGARKTLMKLSPGCQLHQCFTHSFCVHRSQKRKNDSQAISHFGLLGSICVKAASKNVG